jgi:hypothetical protein
MKDLRLAERAAFYAVRMRTTAVVVLISGFLVLPASASAAAQVGFDRDSRLLMTLKQRSLTLTFQTPRSRIPPEVRAQLFGKQVRVACGTRSGRKARAGVVQEIARWSRRARELQVTFRRDLSRRAKWCALEGLAGDTIARVVFVRSERRRLIAHGTAPSGERWRFAAYRGTLREPCAALRVRSASREVSESFQTATCFESFVFDRAELGVVFEVPTCRGDTYVWGAIAPSASQVQVRLADGTVAEAQIYRRPRRSQAGARFFVAVVAGKHIGQRVMALDAKGRSRALRRYKRTEFRADCGFSLIG